ncbi:MAG: hypothetical protein ABSF91_12035 [Bacteroidota bacterium]
MREKQDGDAERMNGLMEKWRNRGWYEMMGSGDWETGRFGDDEIVRYARTFLISNFAF